MPNVNTKTRPIALRISTEAYAVLERRVKHHPRHRTVAHYLRERIEYDLLRKHRKWWSYEDKTVH